MTRKQFIDKAVRETERRLRIPRDWWGTRHDLTDGTRRVYLTRAGWNFAVAGKLVSRHDSRTFAITKARRTAVR